MKTRLSEAAEDYLKAILALQEQNGLAVTSELSRLLNVAPASVSGMLQKLSQMKLVTHRRYQGVKLTPTGRRLAIEVVRHHRLIELYLSEVMGVPWDQVHEEAERLEHAISEKLEERIEEMLGFPTHDPHGAPIPNADGEIAQRPTQPLASLEAAEAVIVAEVDDSDPAFLRYVAELGLFPGVTIAVLKREPFNGPLSLQIDGTEFAIGREAAERIKVAVTN